MLIRNLQFFEQVDNESEIQGGGFFARTSAFTFADRGVGLAGATADAEGNFRTFTKTTTGATASPDTGSAVAGAAAGAADTKKGVAASVTGSVSASL